MRCKKINVFQNIFDAENKAVLHHWAKATLCLNGRGKLKNHGNVKNAASILEACWTLGLCPSNNSSPRWEKQAPLNLAFPNPHLPESSKRENVGSGPIHLRACRVQALGFRDLLLPSPRPSFPP